MDLKGSLIDTHLKIYPTKTLLEFIKKIPKTHETPFNISVLVGENINKKENSQCDDIKQIQLNDTDFVNLNKIKEIVLKNKSVSEEIEYPISEENEKVPDECIVNKTDDSKNTTLNQNKGEINTASFLTISDIDWLYNYIQKLQTNGEKDTPYLHTLLDGANIRMPENKLIKRNPILEARCVKLRAQQEARDYRKMTKSVDNVRMRFPDDTIAYQLKQVNRQLIAVAQLIISIFAGFLFGFKGIEWMIGSLDFGFRLLLGVMCALIITLAEIYFLAKKLNEELNVPETVQLGGPPKFVTEPSFLYKPIGKITDTEKEHQD